jgi:hypothetical protein
MSNLSGTPFAGTPFAGHKVDPRLGHLACYFCSGHLSTRVTDKARISSQSGNEYRLRHVHLNCSRCGAFATKVLKPFLIKLDRPGGRRIRLNIRSARYRMIGD